MMVISVCFVFERLDWIAETYLAESGRFFSISSPRFQNQIPTLIH